MNFLGIKGKVAIFTLGCKVNQYESEAIAERLNLLNIECINNGSNCDVCIINTCTVTGESDRKCRQTIRRAISQNPNSYVIVTGCYSQAAADEVAKIDGVNYVCGNKEKLAVVSKVLEYLSSKNARNKEIEVTPIDEAEFENMSVMGSERTRAYVKIQDGCESNCAYCIIPSVRGKIRSKKPEDVISEINSLASAGYKEVVLTGIEVCAYGKDIEGWDLSKLLCAIDSEVKGIERIRISSIDPAHMKPAFTDIIANLKTIAPHFHLSLQSGCDKTLFAMRRKYNTDMVKRYVKYLREKIPSVHFTADVIVGFPGETDEDFNTTYNFIKELDLLDIHVFAYSKRPGTEAATMPSQVTKEIKSKRSSALISLVANNKYEIYKKVVKSGETLYPLFETAKETEDGKEYICTGHTPNFLEVQVISKTDLHGEILPVKPTKAERDIILCELL